MSYRDLDPWAGVSGMLERRRAELLERAIREHMDAAGFLTWPTSAAAVRLYVTIGI